MSAERFVYDGYELDPGTRRVVCRYSLGARSFTEEVTFELTGDASRSEEGAEAWNSAAVDAAARILFLLAGVSYYKTTAPPVIDLGSTATSAEERAFLRTFFVEGLAEFAYRNALDLSGVEIVGPDTATHRPESTTAPHPASLTLRHGRPLVPFGAGIDSIVTVAHVARRHPGTSLFVVSRTGDRFAAIEDAAAVTGLPVVRAERRIDPSLLGPGDLGFLNGHVPVTGILSAIAVVAAVLGGHDAVVMSNERSASVPTLWDAEANRPVNHQWSKSAAFESAFRRLLAGSLTPAPEYFSLLRARSELWVAQEFAGLDRYLHVFRSCNRAFAIDPTRRLDHWCGTCDKCCFIDLVLAPFVDAAELTEIFGEHEPLRDDRLSPQFRGLLRTGDGLKPFECVGDERECRAAVVLAAARPDRAATMQLQALAEEVRSAESDLRELASSEAALQRLLAPDGPDFVPPDYRDASEPPGTRGGLEGLAGGAPEPRFAGTPSSP